MDSEILTIIYVAAALATIISLFTVVVLFRRPRIKFYHMYGTLLLRIDGKRQKVKLLLGQVVNKQGFFGQTARDIECSLAIPAKMHYSDTSFWTFVKPLPWLDAQYDEEEVVVGPIKSDLDLLKQFERVLWNREKRNIPQGHHAWVPIALLFEGSKKMYWATDPIAPMNELPNGASAQVIPFRLEVSGDNVPSKFSLPSLFLKFPKQMSTIVRGETTSTPNRFLNLLLKLGLWRQEQRFLGEAPGFTSWLRIKPLRLSTRAKSS